MAQSQSMDCLPLWYLIIFFTSELSSLDFVYSDLFLYLLYLFNPLGHFGASSRQNINQLTPAQNPEYFNGRVFNHSIHLYADQTLLALND